MKNMIFKIIAVFAVLIGTASAQTNQEKPMNLENKKVLVVYYSLSGNTQTIANQIKDLTNADIFRIETVTPYPDEYRATTEQAKKEINDGYKPAITSKVSNIADYDVIFVGSPSWWATIAPPVSTFLSEHDLSGKTIVPFVTHGGTGLGNNATDTAKLAPNSTITGAKAFSGSRVNSAQKEVADWIKGLEI